MTGTAKTLTGQALSDLWEFDLPPNNPLDLLDQWLRRAEASDVREPRALTLATSSGEGRLTTRVVLLKDTTPQGILFGSSQHSTKGRSLALHPQAAGTLYWPEILQQINLAGCVRLRTDAAADAAFAARDRWAQAVAWTSQQSETLEDEQQLREEVARLAGSDDPLPRPPHWSLYEVVIDEIEFWSGSTDRLHRRLRFQLEHGSWTSRRLQP